ncbi:MAG: PilZ domain-containing protein [Desulfobulbaceae bacterium]|nr:PilZ domain-containing protein [Desulfobulbaceae bacterium]
MKSKRLAFRFCCDHYPIQYKTAYGEGEAALLDISVNGCAFEKVTEPLGMDEKVLLIVKLDEDNILFEAQAEVIRADNGVIAVRYLLVEPEAQILVRNFFSKRLREK